MDDNVGCGVYFRLGGVFLIFVGLFGFLMSFASFDCSLSYASDTCEQEKLEMQGSALGTAIFGMILDKLGGGHPIRGAWRMFQRITPFGSRKGTSHNSAKRSAARTPGSLKEPSGDVESELRKAKDYFEQGLIDEDEYKRMRRKIIEGS